MTVNIFVDILEATLLNSPSISSLNGVKTDAKHISRGDLFIAFDENKIQEAIDNGAYGILVNKDIDIIDNEIAWIKVDDIYKSLKRLTDVSFVSKNNTIMLVEPFEYSAMKSIFHDKTNVVFLSGDIKTDIEFFFNSKKNTYFICSNEEYVHYFRNIKTLSENVKDYKIVKYTMFETTFIYNEKLYENMRFPYIFLHNFIKVLEYFNATKINFNINSFQSDNYKPFFVNQCFESLGYEKSEKVLIFEHDFMYIQNEIKFTMKEKWSKTVILLPKAIKSLGYKNDSIIYFTDESDLIEKIKNLNYLVALIFADSKSILGNLHIKKEQKTLF